MPGAPLVTTRHGRLRGADLGDVRVFRGVRYAAPPTGARRWQPPAPPADWDGERDALDFGPMPPQLSDGLDEALGMIRDAAFEEDCLTLNLWTPGPDAGRRPVLVWIPGGAFTSGSGSAPPYDGARLAGEGGVVVVTVTYRVGALGFLATHGSANFGLLDQIAALRWVREHAAAFGGDPDRITVFGESAGAGSLCALLAMPAARGLFRRAIVQSAAPTAMIDAAEAARRADKLRGRLGRSLRDVPIEELLAAQQECVLEGPHSCGMFFVPVVDGDTLPKRPLAAVADGDARDVELVIGTTRQEMQLFALGVDPPVLEAVDEAALREAVAAELAGQVDAPETHAGPLVDVYRKTHAGAAPHEILWAVQSDVRLRFPSIRLAERQACHNARTWMYRFDPVSPLQGGELGSCHALDLPYTFGSFAAPRMAEFAGSGPTVEAISRTLRGAWCAFAADGEPGRTGGVDWPSYAASRRATLRFDVRCDLLDAPGEAERAALAALPWTLDP